MSQMCDVVRCGAARMQDSEVACRQLRNHPPKRGNGGVQVACFLVATLPRCPVACFLVDSPPRCLFPLCPSLFPRCPSSFFSLCPAASLLRFLVSSLPRCLVSLSLRCLDASFPRLFVALLLRFLVASMPVCSLGTLGQGGAWVKGGAAKAPFWSISGPSAWSGSRGAFWGKGI